MSSGGVISVCIRIKITPGVEKLVPNWLLVVYPELIHRAEEPKNKKNKKISLVSVLIPFEMSELVEYPLDGHFVPP